MTLRASSWVFCFACLIPFDTWLNCFHALAQDELTNRQLFPLTVYIECDFGGQTGAGSGVIVGTKGEILTAKHVIGLTGENQVIPEGTQCRGSVGERVPHTELRKLTMIRAAKYDALLLRMEPDTKWPKQVAKYCPINGTFRGAKLHALGFLKPESPDKLSLQETKPTSRYGEIENEGADHSNHIIAGTKFSHGMSGGGVFFKDTYALAGSVMGATFDSDGTVKKYDVLELSKIAQEFSLQEYEWCEDISATPTGNTIGTLLNAIVTIVDNLVGSASDDDALLLANLETALVTRELEDIKELSSKLLDSSEPKIEALAHYNQGVIAAIEGNMAQAAEKFQSAAQIDPSVHYLITASEFSAKAEDLETAENLAQRALNRVEDEREPSQIDLKRSSALTQLANIKLLRRAEDDSTIEALYREVLENDRAAGLEETIHHSAHLNNLALFLRLLGDNAAAGDLFIEAKAISEKLGATDYRSYASLIANHATNLFQWGRHLEARLNIDKALKLDEKNQRLGELGHAIRLTTRALFFAENVSAFNCNRAKKDARSALDLLKGLPQKTSHKAIVVNNLGEVLRECGDYKGARPYLEEAVELSEDAYKTDPNPFIFRKDLLILDALEGEVDDFEETMQHYIGYLTLRLSKDHYQVNKAVRQRDAILDGGIK